MRHPRKRLQALVLLAALMLVPSTAFSASPDEALERLMTQPLDPAWFAPAFLEHVPAEHVKSIIEELTQALGAYERVIEGDEQYLIYFAHGIVPAAISLDPEGRVQGLFIHPPRPRVSRLDEVLAAVRALPGRTALLVASETGVLAAHNEETPLAVGSAFKLAVLAALRDEIDRGQRRWDEVVGLPHEARSLPTGIMQTWPAGSPVTLHTLAALMISLSDNTATDALIHVLGRRAIESYTPRNTPFLTTREAFILKAPENAPLLDRYRQADVDERRRLLEQEIAPLPPPPASAFVSDQVAAPDVEWFFSAAELCSLMGRVDDLPLMGINPGIASTQQWERVAYKGGSEPGVLSFVSSLWDREGRRYCVAAVWNDESPLDEAAFYGMYAALIDVLAKGAWR